MSTTLDSVRTEEEETAPTVPPAAWITGDDAATTLDVSEVSPARVAAYARRADGEVHFERKGGRTFLVAA